MQKMAQADEDDEEPALAFCTIAESKLSKTKLKNILLLDTTSLQLISSATRDLSRTFDKCAMS
jgi:hypothetical protein